MSQWFPVFLMWKGKPEEHRCVWVTSSGQGHLLAAAGEAWRRGGGCSGKSPLPWWSGPASHGPGCTDSRHIVKFAL